MKNLQVFCSEKFGSVRMVMIDDQPWFVAKDACEILELSNPTMVISRLDDDERAKLNLGRQGQANIVNESGLYALVLASRKSEAKAFKRWITHEILPSIRKTGGYGQPIVDLGSVVKMMREIRERMKDQGCSPREIAIAQKSLCDQYGISLPECFIKPEETSLKDVHAMIDYIFSQPRGRGHKVPTYEDFIIEHTIRVKQIES